MIKFYLKNNKGFTLLEVLVAVSILMVAVAAPITISQKGISSAVYSKNQMIASYLAQDAIEYIKNRRDKISINNGFSWLGLNVFSPCLGENNYCQIDTIKNSSNISDDINTYSDSIPLRLGDASASHLGLFQYMDGTDTSFTRKINIVINPSNPDEALVTVAVSWGSVANTVTVKTLIYNY